MELKNYFAQDASGNAVVSPTAYLYLPGSTTLATGLQDKDGGVLPNPFTGTIQGLIQFQAPDGEYDLRVVGGGRDYTIRVRCVDGTLIPTASAARDQAVAANGAAQIAAATATANASAAINAAISAQGGAQTLTTSVSAGGSLPFEVTAISGGVGTGTGGTPGEYALVVSGGPAGHTAFGTIGADGKVSSYRVGARGIATSNSAPTYAWPSGTGLTGATLPTATVSALADGRIFFAPNANSGATHKLAWQSASGAIAPYNVGGAQWSDYLKAGVDAIATGINRNEQAVSLGPVEAQNQFTVAELGFTSKILITGNSDTIAERTGNLGAWKLTSGAGLSKSWTRRFDRTLLGSSESVSASVLIQKADAASAGTGIGRCLLIQRDSALAEIGSTRSTINFCDQTGLASPSRIRHENITLNASCAYIDLYLDLSAVGSNARSVWFREMMLAGGPNAGFRWPVAASKPDVVWVSPTGADTNAGTQAAPFLTINAAADALLGVGEIRIAAGSYSWTSNSQRLDPTKVKDIKIRGERGLTSGTFDNLPIIRLAAKVTGITKTAGRTKIYQATLTSPGTSANFQFAFQDGVADPRTAVATGDRPWLPELRGRSNWLPNFARLVRTTATTLSAALDEIDAAGANDPRAFLDDSTNILYFSIVGGGDGTAANIYYAASAGLTASSSATRESCGRIRIENIETRYGGIDLTPYRYAALREVRFLGAKTNVIDYSNLHLEGGVEVACAGALIALTGDGVNGKLGAKLTGRGLVSHYNNDDGLSPHEGNSCDLENALFAYNGGTAVAIAYGADGSVRNARSLRNQQRADPITPANRYKPGAFAVVGSPSEEPNTDGGVDTCAIFQNCISIEDYTSFYSDDATGDTAYGTAINCTSIRPVTQGYNITKIVDCDYIASGTSTAKDARVSVENGTLVS